MLFVFLALVAFLAYLAFKMHAASQPPAPKAKGRRHWRDDPATDKQIDFADDLGIRTPERFTKGDLSDQIDQAVERQREERGRGVGVKCPICQRKIWTSEKLAGTDVTCPDCYCDVRVPGVIPADKVDDWLNE